MLQASETSNSPSNGQQNQPPAAPGAPPLVEPVPADGPTIHLEGVVKKAGGEVVSGAKVALRIKNKGEQYDAGLSNNRDVLRTPPRIHPANLPSIKLAFRQDLTKPFATCKPVAAELKCSLGPTAADCNGQMSKSCKTTKKFNSPFLLKRK